MGERYAAYKTFLYTLSIGVPKKMRNVKYSTFYSTRIKMLTYQPAVPKEHIV